MQSDRILFKCCEIFKRKKLLLKIYFIKNTVDVLLLSVNIENIIMCRKCMDQQKNERDNFILV